jgi:hypothetical protein
MATATNDLNAAIAYDKTVVREYLKKRGNWIISWYKKVRMETISNTLILDIKAEKLPDQVFFNGEPMTLTPFIYD